MSSHSSFAGFSNRILAAALAGFLSLAASGCAGRQANMVTVYQPGDEQLSCERLESEMAYMQGEIVRLIPQADKTAKNWILGTTGWFFIVPFFFMDLSKAEQQEINALRHRYNHLLENGRKKGCSTDRQPLPDFSDKAAMKLFYSEQRALFPHDPAKTDQGKSGSDSSAESRGDATPRKGTVISTS